MYTYKYTYIYIYIYVSFLYIFNTQMFDTTLSFICNTVFRHLLVIDFILMPTLIYQFRFFI